MLSRSEKVDSSFERRGDRHGMTFLCSSYFSAIIAMQWTVKKKREHSLPHLHRTLAL